MTQDTKAVPAVATPQLPAQITKDNPPQAFLAELGYTKQQWQVLTQQFFPSAKSLESCLLVATMCKAKGLDLMSKPFHIVPLKKYVGKDGSGESVFQEVDQIWPGIAYYEIVAHRTKEYAGTEPVEFGPHVSLNFGGEKREVPEWAIATVYRLVNGQKQAFKSNRLYAEETAKTNHKGKLTDMWNKSFRAQLAKCAHAAALRMAFPEVGAEPTAEEMQGALLVEPGEATPGPRASADRAHLIAAERAEANGDTVDAVVVPTREERLEAAAAVAQERGQHETADAIRRHAEATKGISNQQATALMAAGSKKGWRPGDVIKLLKEGFTLPANSWNKDITPDQYDKAVNWMQQHGPAETYTET